MLVSICQSYCLRVSWYYFLFLATLDAGISPRHKRPATRTGLNYEDTKSVAMQIMADLFFNCFELDCGDRMFTGRCQTICLDRGCGRNIEGQPHKSLLLIHHIATAGNGVAYVEMLFKIGLPSDSPWTIGVSQSTWYHIASTNEQ